MLPHTYPLYECRDQLGQPLPIAAAANELYKAARTEHGDDDFTAVYETTTTTKTKRPKLQ